MASTDDNSDVVTMLDVLNDENDLSDKASAVLSGSDEKNCNGFVKRQALYSCLTCAPEGSKTDFTKSIGICLACSLHCHDKHELVELYTKRNFRCDCGLKPGSETCQLDANKTGREASNNKYNQNFVGLYCKCHRPYPDPEDTVNDEMIQCSICEDWSHLRHLNTKSPSPEAFDEMICGECMKRNDFLRDYSGLAIVALEPEGDGNDSSLLNVTSLDTSASNTAAEADGSPSSKKLKLSDDVCVRPKVDNLAPAADIAMFWRENWRKSLCKCSACMKLYADSKLEFLIDLEDTTRCYEEKGKGKEGPSRYMASLEALSSLPHVNQIDAISSYNRMKDKLFEFLQTFVVNNQIVTEDDIQRFFRNMKESNDQPAQQPHFCR